MSKKTGFFTVFVLVVLAGLTFTAVYSPAETDRSLALAPAVEASIDLDYVEAAENKAFRWNAMAEAYENRGLPISKTISDDLMAYRWNAMAEAYEKRGLLSSETSPDEAMAYRWIAMARVYEKNDLLNELRDLGDDSVAFRWVAMAQAYEKNGLLTQD